MSKYCGECYHTRQAHFERSKSQGVCSMRDCACLRYVALVPTSKESEKSIQKELFNPVDNVVRFDIHPGCQYMLIDVEVWKRELVATILDDLVTRSRKMSNEAMTEIRAIAIGYYGVGPARFFGNDDKWFRHASDFLLAEIERQKRYRAEEDNKENN